MIFGQIDALGTALRICFVKVYKIYRFRKIYLTLSCYYDIIIAQYNIFNKKYGVMR